MSEPSLTKRTTASVLWMTAQKWASRIGGLVAIIVLTRLLTPEDFGLAAAATTFMPMLYILADVGFTTYIIQSEHADSRTLNTAFWFSVASGLVLTGVVVAVAPFMGWLMNLPEVVPLLQTMAASVFIIALASVPMALLRRRMAFRALAIMEVSGSLTAQIVAITAAILGAGAWALVLQAIVAQLIATVWVWSVAKWRPAFEFSRSAFKVVGSFGVKVLASELVMVARAWAETAIIVVGLGVREMGYINIAQRLVQTAQDVSVAALGPVSMVAFARVRGEPERVRSSYLRASSIAYSVVAPLMLYIAIVAPVLVPFLFGDDKSPSAAIVPALAVVFFISIGWPIDQGLHIGMGRPGLWLAIVAVAYGTSAGMLAVSVGFGLTTLLIVWMAAALVESLVRWFGVRRLIGASIWQIAKPLLSSLIPAGISAGLGYGVFRLMSDAPDILNLACTGIVVVISYLLAMRYLRRRTFVDVIEALPDRASRYLRWTLPRDRRSVPSADQP